MYNAIQTRAVNKLIVYSSLPSIGFLDGKMGLCVFFMHYYKYTKLEVYKDIAEYLLSEVINNIHKKLPINFASGLCGIVWGIEYLIHNNFIEGDGVDIFGDIDCEIMTRDPRRITDLSLHTGLEGHLHYVLAHLLSVSSLCKTPFDNLYLKDLYDRLITINKSQVDKRLQALIDSYILFYETGEVIYTMDLLSIVTNFQAKKDENELINLTPSLLGIAGYILNEIEL